MGLIDRLRETLSRRPSAAEDAEAAAAADEVRGHTMLPRPRLLHLYAQIARLERDGLDGAMVECGVWKGGAVGVMALASLRHGRAPRHLHLFDSFEGIPEPDAALDGAKAVEQVRSVGGGTSGRLEPVRGFYERFAGGVGTLPANRELLEGRIGYPPDHLHYHVGWFQDTVPRDAAAIGAVALLRLDGDWYASTKVCLEHLYDLVVPGGVVIVDDYGCYEGCKLAVTEYFASRGIAPPLRRIDGEARWFRKSG